MKSDKKTDRYETEEIHIVSRLGLSDCSHVWGDMKFISG